eukprot:gene2467-2770_t
MGQLQEIRRTMGLQASMDCLQVTEVTLQAVQDARISNKYECDKLRAAYWDPSVSSTPSLLTSSTVRVYDSTGRGYTYVTNPFVRNCFRATARSSQDGTKNAGSCVSRAGNWASSMASMAGNFQSDNNQFLWSSWSCTNLGQGSSCSGNLEGFHNNVHNTVGGTNGGDMATLSFAPWDAIFMLHHVNVDRLLYLFQVNTGVYSGSSNYLPFPARAACGAAISSCGYSYGSNIGAAAAAGDPGAQAAAAAAADPYTVDMTSGGDPNSDQARQYLDNVLRQLSGGYEGYTWNVVVNNVNFTALENRTFSLHVLLKQLNVTAAPLPKNADSTIDLDKLRARQDYCYSFAGFNTWAPHMPLNQDTRSVAIAITPCLQRNGINPDVSPKDPADPTSGPAALPITRQNIRLLCIDSAGLDCTPLVRKQFKVALGWSILTKTFDPTAQTFGPPAEVSAASTADLGVEKPPKARLFKFSRQVPF